MNILALDTSTKHTGCAWFKGESLFRQGVIDLDDKDTGERIEKMILLIYETIDRIQPDQVVIEEVQIVKYSDVTIKLAKIIGAVIGKCASMGIPYKLMGASTWRSKMKMQDPRMKREELKKLSVERVKKLYGKEVSDDEADAILIGTAFFR